MQHRIVNTLLNSLVILSTVLFLTFGAPGITPAQAASATDTIMPPLPIGLTTARIQGIWGSGANDIYAVGSGSSESGNTIPVIYHNDGSAWGTITPDLPYGWQYGSLSGIWGSGSNDIYAVGEGEDALGNTLPLLYHYDGNDWYPITTDLPSGLIYGELYAAWGSGPNDIYAVGKGMDADINGHPLLYHYDGDTWSSITPDLPSGWQQCGTLTGIWGSGTDDVYAVGSGCDASWNTLPLLYHYDGSNWSSITPDLPSDWFFGKLTGAWGSSSNNIYAVGYGATDSNEKMPLLYHYDGSNWSSITPGLPVGLSEMQLSGAWGSGANDIYAVGYALDAGGYDWPTLSHYDGSSWSSIVLEMPGSSQDTSIFGVWGFTANNVYAVGAGYNENWDEFPVLYQYDGADWNSITPALPVELTQGKLRDTWGSGPNDVYAVGFGTNESDSHSLLYHYNGSNWNDIILGLPVGWRCSELDDMWGSGANNVYIAGYGCDESWNHRPLLYQYDGSDWNSITPDLPSGLLDGEVNGMWGSSANDVYAVGYGIDESWHIQPILYHYDGSAWSSILPELPVGWSNGFLEGAWGTGSNDVYAVGKVTDDFGYSQPLVYHYDGSSWTSTTLPLSDELISGYFEKTWGSGANDVYAVGYGKDADWDSHPMLYHFDGSSWSSVSVSLPSGWLFGEFHGIWGTGANDVYAVGYGWDDSYTILPVLYHYDGSNWSSLTPDLPFESDGSTLFSVWGSSANDIYAAGASYFSGLGDRPLIYHLAQTYTVTFNSNGGTGTMDPQTDSAPADLTLNSFTRDGYTFTGWSTSPTGMVAYEDGQRYDFSANLDLYAQWTADSYTLTVNSAHGTVTKSPDQTTYHYGDVITLSVTPEAGWTFTGWTPSLTDNQVTIQGNTTVTANFTQDEYTLTANSAHGAVTRTPDQATYHYGDVVTLGITPDAGWTFTGWTPSLTGNQVTITGNTTLTANYTQDEYSLTVNSAHGTVTKSPDQATYHYGDVVTLSVTPEAGWTFTGWTPSLTNNQVTITGNTTVTANFTQDEYTLTVNSMHGTVTKTPYQATYHYGDVVTLSANSDAGWTFTGWTPSLTNNQVTITGNTTVTANFTQDEYTLTVNSMHGTVTKSPDQATYHYGDVVTLSVTPEAGWTFSGWTPSLTGNQVTITGNTTVTANYTQDEYSLTVNSVHGTVTKSPDQATYHYGDVVTLSVTPEAGWTFSGWTPSLTDNQVTITGNTTVTANYTQDEYSLTINSAHGTVTKTPDQATYHYGDVVTLGVAPEAGWTFSGWTPSLTDNQVTITGNTTVTANYTQDEYSLTVNSAHGTVTKSPDQATYHYGDVVTLGVAPEAGWTFTGWTPVLTDNQVTITGNTTVTANYTQDEYSLTINSAHGTVTKTPDQATYHYGDVVTLSVTPEAGWTFTGWTPVLTDNQVTITGNATVTANYTQDEYSLTINSAHGTVTKSPDQATYHYGDVVTLSVTPEADWAFRDWTPSLTDNQVTISGNTTVTANYRQIPAITWANPADILYGTPLSDIQLNATASTPGAFTYTPASGTVLDAGPHTLHVEFTPTDTTNFTSASKDVSLTVLEHLIFADVPNDHWAKSFIERLYFDRITGGCGGTPLNYCPNRGVTRAELAVFLLRSKYGAAYLPPALVEGTGFNDVPDGYWAAAWIKQLVAEGITTGCGNGNFCPERNVTRAELSVLLLVTEHGINFTPDPATGLFSDVPEEHWAAAWVEQLVAEGVTGGCGSNKFCPNQPVTRAQVAVFLVTAFNLP